MKKIALFTCICLSILGLTSTSYGEKLDDLYTQLIESEEGSSYDYVGYLSQIVNGEAESAGYSPEYSQLELDRMDITRDLTKNDNNPAPQDRTVADPVVTVIPAR